MKLNNLTASAFANSVGVQPSSVSHILSGRNKPSLEFIQKVLSAYPKVDSNWLISGTTNVQKEEIKKEELANEEVKPEVKQKIDNPVVEQKYQSSERKIDKILIFYTDGTFEEFQSS